MKVVCKGKAVKDVRDKTVFSGTVESEWGRMHKGIWMRCSSETQNINATRVVNLETGATLGNRLNVVHDYKELNAYLCIEE